ncbi:MAG: hemolysin family protein [Bacillota bacterium]
MSLFWSLLAVPLLISLNAFFVASEYTVVAIRPAQIEGMRGRGQRRAARAIEQLKENPTSAIGAIQVCITMANLLLGWVGEPAMSAILALLLSPLIQLSPGVFTSFSIALSFIIVTLLTVVFSELLPKALTLQYLPTTARLTALPVLAIQKAVYPLVWVMNQLANLVTRPLGLGDVEEPERQQMTIDELRMITTDAAAHGVLTSRERSLILNSLAMGRRTARQIMVPRTRVAYLDLQRSMDENRAVMNAYLHSRLPLCDGGLDHVVGVVHTKEFLTAYHAAGESPVLSLIARPAVFAPERIPLDKLLEVFRDNRTQMVFLVDEYGGVEGIVTLQDVVDELVGEIDTVPASTAGSGSATTARPGAMVVGGEMPVHELAERIGRSNWGISSPAATVGGLIIAGLGRFPVSGEELQVDRVHLRVLETEGRVVRQVEVRSGVESERDIDTRVD